MADFIKKKRENTLFNLTGPSLNDSNFAFAGNGDMTFKFLLNMHIELYYYREIFKTDLETFDEIKVLTWIYQLLRSKKFALS